MIADSINLPKNGYPIEVAYTYPVRGEAVYRWRITGRSETGEEVDFVTETLSLSEESVDPEIALSLSAVPRTPRINRAGDVIFDIEIANAGNIMAVNALLYEVTHGKVRSFAVLPTGDPTLCTVSYAVKSDAQFIFCLNYTDAGGHQRTISTAPINVEIASDGVAPERPESDDLELKGGSVKIGTSSTFLILLSIAGIALVSMFIILLITSHRMRRERKARIAAEKQRLKEEMGKTNRFTPIKRVSDKKKT